jgi:DNA segregation ATPase FtsK/SpoIIIE, S-DNA-T family
MQLRLTLAAAGSVMPIDVTIEAPSGTTLDDMRPLLAAWVPCRETLFAAGRQVPGNALLGEPPLVHGAVLPDSAAALADERAAPAVLQLRVVGGSDAGTIHPLGPGETTIGRAAGAHVRIDDPDVSRVHAAVSLTDSGLAVRDLGSTNGTQVDSSLVTTGPTQLAPGQLLHIGSSALTVVVSDEAVAATSPDGQGFIHVNRPPRMRATSDAVRLRYPAEPAHREAPRFPLLAIALPLLLGAVMFTVMDSEPMWLAFMLLSPLMLIGNGLSERVGGRRRQRREQRAYQQKVAQIRDHVTAAVAQDVARRRYQALDPAALLLMAMQPQARLWERRRKDDDFLSIRLGTADLPSTVILEEPHGTACAEQPMAAAAPVVVRLRDAGVLGIAGPRVQVEGLARWIVAQIAAWHSPRDVRVVLLMERVAAVATWQWASWLPHLQTEDEQADRLLLGIDDEGVAVRIAELTAVLDARQEAMNGASGGSGPWSGPSTVVVLDGSRRIRATAGMARLLAEGPRCGIYAVCVAVAATDLAAECGATAVITGEVGSHVDVRASSLPTVTGAIADRVSMAWAWRLARAFAPLCDATPRDADAGLPMSARLLELLHLEPVPDAVRERWREGRRSTSVRLGVSTDGPFDVDLAVDGPHMLVAGTTGSGKSELLQTLVASLAVTNRPDEMAFVLIDYKGGSAFSDCARLPHAVGLVTDLDEHLTERSMLSLDAELKRRERVLRAAAAKDIDTYQATADRRGLPAMARLVLVIDEFATLVAELPDFVRGLIDIAQRGRSLGVHLVLATQRPGGVVNSDIRANTGIRIALRVTDQRSRAMSWTSRPLPSSRGTRPDAPMLE